MQSYNRVVCMNEKDAKL